MLHFLNDWYIGVAQEICLFVACFEVIMYHDTALHLRTHYWLMVILVGLLLVSLLASCWKGKLSLLPLLKSCYLKNLSLMEIFLTDTKIGLQMHTLMGEFVAKWSIWAPLVFSVTVRNLHFPCNEPNCPCEIFFYFCLKIATFCLSNFLNQQCHC